MTTVSAERPALSRDRTVDRTLVHRTALEEVFLTDFESRPDGFAGTARLPRAHAYYNEHLNHPAVHDPIAVFECVRQLLLCALHLHHGATGEMKSITATCSLALPDPRALVIRDDYELLLLGRVARHKEHGGVTTRALHEVEVRLGDAVIGQVAVDTAQKDARRYDELRMAFRDTAPPLSSELIDDEPVSRVPPHLVGRTNPDNVLLLAPKQDEGGLTARLRVPVSHPGMFDHPHDHVPGPVMMEAARQAGTLLLCERFGQAPSKSVLTGLEAAYARFAELDAGIVIEARPGAGPADPIGVRFLQSGEPVAEMTITMGTTLGWRP
ncbi:MAG: hypothetical protein HOV96_38115 [Nonomuraea sp.]|nr:hypothetical protein [Nonomuraea sp.]NUP67396.1 hypothetical protein [Nonomuraea sp.]NUP83361.1 hypothetical protein [Nonomuraea sp.]